MFAVDLRSLAALRIGLASIILLDLCIRAGSLTAHYTDFGVMPRTLVSTIVDSPWSWSLHMISGVAPIEGALFLIAAVCAVFLLIGFRTRFFTIASWVLLLSLQNRNPMILQGGDVLLRMMLFFGMFLPLGARWSADAVLHPPPRESGSTFVSMGAAALLLQVAFMYWFSVLLKTDPVWWRDYTAIYCALHLEHFVTGLGKLLWPYHGLMKGLTIGAIVIEGLGPFVVLLGGFMRWQVRTLAIAGLIAFHVGMSLCLQLGLFSLICSVAWIPFLPGGFWNWLDNVCRRPRCVHLRNRAMFMLDKIAFVLNGWARVSRFGTYNLRPSRFSHALALFFITYILLWNIRTTNFNRFSHVFPEKANWVAWLCGTGQVWDMFSPAPLREGGWFVMPAQLADGTQVDLWRDGAPVQWDKPHLISAMYRNDRWRKYMVVFAASTSADRRLAFGQWMAREWNAAHRPEQRIMTFQIFLMEQDTRPDYTQSAPKPVALWFHDCTGKKVAAK